MQANVSGNEGVNRASIAAGIAIANLAPDDSRLRIKSSVKGQLRRFLKECGPSRHRNKRRTRTLTFNGILKTIMARIRLNGVTTIMDVERSSNCTLNAVKGHVAVIVLLLIMRRRNIRVIRFTRGTIMQRRSFRVSKLVTPFDSFYVTRRLLSNNLRVDSSITLYVTYNNKVMMVKILKAYCKDYQRLIRERNSFRLRSQYGRLRVLFRQCWKFGLVVV